MAWQKLPNNPNTALPPGNYRLTLAAPSNFDAHLLYNGAWKERFEAELAAKYDFSAYVTDDSLNGNIITIYLHVATGPSGVGGGSGMSSVTDDGEIVPAQFMAALLLGEVIAVLAGIFLITLKVQSIEKDVTSSAQPGTPIGKAVTRISQGVVLGALAAALFAGAYLIRGVH